MTGTTHEFCLVCGRVDGYHDRRFHDLLARIEKLEAAAHSATDTPLYASNADQKVTDDIALCSLCGVPVLAHSPAQAKECREKYDAVLSTSTQDAEQSVPEGRYDPNEPGIPLEDVKRELAVDATDDTLECPDEWPHEPHTLIDGRRCMGRTPSVDVGDGGVLGAAGASPANEEGNNNASASAPLSPYPTDNLREAGNNLYSVVFDYQRSVASALDEESQESLIRHGIKLLELGNAMKRWVAAIEAVQLAEAAADTATDNSRSIGQVLGADPKTGRPRDEAFAIARWVSRSVFDTKTGRNHFDIPALLAELDALYGRSSDSAGDDRA